MSRRSREIEAAEDRLERLGAQGRQLTPVDRELLLLGVELGRLREAWGAFLLVAWSLGGAVAALTLLAVFLALEPGA